MIDRLPVFLLRGFDQSGVEGKIESYERSTFELKLIERGDEAIESLQFDLLNRCKLADSCRRYYVVEFQRQ